MKKKETKKRKKKKKPGWGGCGGFQKRARTDVKNCELQSQQTLEGKE